MSIKTSPFGPVREARKLFFHESISKCSITVEINEVGWIHVRQFKGNGGFFGNTPIYCDLSLTPDDANNLIFCLSELLSEISKLEQQNCGS